VWSPPTVTDAQSLEPMSSSTGKRRTDVVGSLHAATTRVATSAIPDPFHGTPPRPPSLRENAMHLSKGFRAALVFGIIAATIEMGLILWMARC
jgi:hypothetical protein